MNQMRDFKNKMQTLLQENKIARIGMWIIVLCYPFYLAIIANAISFQSHEKLINLLTQNTGAFLYGLFIVTIIFWILIAIMPHMSLAVGISGLLFIALPLIDYFKTIIRNEHFLPWDVLLAGNAESFTQFLNSLVFPAMLIPIVLLTLVFVLFFVFANPKIPAPWTVRGAGALILVILLYNSVMHEDERVWAMERSNIIISTSMDQAAIYDSYGFITSFVLNFASLDISEPQNYSKAFMEYAFEDYLPSADSGEDFPNPDIIIILSESFWDPTALEGVTFSSDPLENYRAIAAEHPSGKMVSCTFGGGTVRPEFEILSGLTTSSLPPGNIPYQQYMSRDVFTYAQLYKSMGYDTLGVHTYQKNFYDRDKAYPRMGIDEILGEYDLNAELHWNSGPYITDETIAEEVIFQLEEPHETGLFLMAITMENHGLYREKYSDKERKITVTSDDLNEQQIKSLENYATGTSNSDKALKTIYDYVMTREKPTVVLWYGDHLPTLGEDFMPYTTTGTISSETALSWSQEEKLTMFSTPYVIFANYDTGNEYKAEDTAVSPYLLSPLMADYIGTPECLQTNFLLHLFEISPVISPYYELYSEGSDERLRNEMMELHDLLTYDQLIGDQYSAPLETAQ